MKSVETRLVDLETTLTFQAELIDQLNEVVTEQAGELDEMRRRLERMEAKVAGTESEGLS